MDRIEVRTADNGYIVVINPHDKQRRTLVAATDQELYDIFAEWIVEFGSPLKRKTSTK